MKRNNQKKLIIINGLLIGGAERVVVNILSQTNAASLADLACLQKKNEIGKISPSLRIFYLSRMQGNESRFIKLLLSPILLFNLFRLIQKEGYRTIQAHLYRASILSMLLKPMLPNTKIEIVIHGDPNQYRYKGIPGRLIYFLINWLFPKANLLIVNSEGMKKALLRYLEPVIFEKIIVEPNRFDIAKIHKMMEEPIEQSALPLDRKLITNVGRMIASKRQIDLIKAFSRISEHFPDVDLLFLGDGPEFGNLKLLSKQYNLNGRIHFQGVVNNPFSYIRHSLISVVASESETFGNVIVESLICGIPVIASDCEYGPREILDPDGKGIHPLGSDVIQARYGLLYPVGDVQALGEALVYLLSNKRQYNLYKKLSDEGSRKYDVEASILLSNAIGEGIND